LVASLGRLKRVCWQGLVLSFAIVSQAGADGGRVVVETAYLSRGVYVPATVDIPMAAAEQKVPVVIMAHGHGGDREEAGAFGWMARELSARGIASIRMDFPGCGDSPDPFSHNDITNMLEDLQAARDFVLAELPVDPERIGILGYSMGGRLAVLAAEKSPYAAMAVWSPVGQDGKAGMLKFMGGEAAWVALRRKAEEEGQALFITPWGQQQELGLRWFVDLERSRPESAIATFSGPLLLVHGAADETVAPANSRVLAAAARRATSTELFMVDDAGHGLGFYSGNEDIATRVIERTIGFFERQLAQSQIAVVDNR
jgi:dipeptidyl aminopeptidase/acylaminoacyl peptidase